MNNLLFFYIFPGHSDDMQKNSFNRNDNDFVGNIWSDKMKEIPLILPHPVVFKTETKPNFVLETIPLSHYRLIC